MDVRDLKDKASQFFAKGKFAKAAETYEEYCRADAKDLQARLRLGDAWAKAGKKDKAIIAYTWAAEGFAKDGFLPRAIAASKLVLELDPAHKGVQKMLADLYARKSSSPSRISKPATPAPLPEVTAETVTHAAAAPGTAPGFANRADAIDLEVESPRAKAAADVSTPAVRAPSPTTRPDAIEIEFDAPAGAVAEEIIDLEPSPEIATGVEIEPEPEAVDDVSPVLASLPPLKPATRLDVTPVESLRAAAPPAEPPPPRPSVLPISFELDVEPTPSAPLFDLVVEVPPSAPLAPTAPPPPDDAEVVEAEPLDEVVEAARESAPPLPEDAVPPPGLRPRSSPQVPPLVDSDAPFQSSPSRIRLPESFAPRREPPAPAAPPPTGAFQGSTSSSSDLERSLHALMQFDDTRSTTQAPPFVTTPSGIAASFTELELEDDSLLHAVEAAAHRPVSTVEESIEPVDEPRLEPGALPKIPLFSDLPADAFIALFEQCPLRRFDEGATIIEQGSTGESFFVICAGRVKVLRTDAGQPPREIASLDEGAFFGEMSLLSDAPRSASVLAGAEDTQVLEISASLLKELSARYPTISTALKKFCRQRLLSNLMSSAPLFRPFSRSDRRELIQKFRAREVRANDVVITEGALCDGLYVVLSGEVEVRVKGARVASLREGELFGEMSLLTKSKAQASVVATRHTSLLRLPRSDFDALILSYPQILEHVAELTDARRQQNSV